MSKKKSNKTSGGQPNKPGKQHETYNHNIYATVPKQEIPGTYVIPELPKWHYSSLKDIPAFEKPFSSLSTYVAEIRVPKEPSEVEIRKLRSQIKELKKRLWESDKTWTITLERHDLLRYFSGEDADAIIKNDLQFKDKGRCELTVLNCDIRNFTKFVDKLKDPEYLAELLNPYLIRCTEIIHKHGGAVDKYMGDGVLAYFGCFSNRNGHAENACKAAKEIIEEGDVMFESWYKRLLHRPSENYLGIGIGICTGWILWDKFGNPDREELSIIGSHVNLAERLQSIAGPGEIIISGVTRGILGNEWHTDTIDKEKEIKGFEGKVDVFQLLCE